MYENASEVRARVYSEHTQNPVCLPCDKIEWKLVLPNPYTLARAHTPHAITPRHIWTAHSKRAMELYHVSCEPQTPFSVVENGCEPVSAHFVRHFGTATTFSRANIQIFVYLNHAFERDLASRERTPSPIFEYAAEWNVDVMRSRNWNGTLETCTFPKFDIFERKKREEWLSGREK